MPTPNDCFTLRNTPLDHPTPPRRGTSPLNSALFDINQSDVTGTVNMVNPAAVADAICGMMARRYGDFDEDVVRQGFIDLEDIFWGRYPGLLPCDTPYHDLRHSMSTTLAMARMVDGYELVHGDESPLGVELATLGVLLALFHDVGFIRRSAESGINGASLIREHEQRSVDFTCSYLAKGSLARFAELAVLIHTTNFAKSAWEIFDGVSPQLVEMGKMLGTADLISQISGRYYLERCHYALFEEFVAAGADRTSAPNGETVILYATPEDLLRKTPLFYQHMVKPRLENYFDHAYLYIAAHFGGDDPYARAIQRNLDFLRDMIQRNDFSGLHRKPVPLMPSEQERRTVAAVS